MARLHEYQGKKILKEAGVLVPRGVVVKTPREAFEVFSGFSNKVVIKAQAWITGRKALGGVDFAETAAEAKEISERMFSLSFGNFPITELLVEECLEIKDEYFVSITIDDKNQSPLLLLDLKGGTGIEDRADAVLKTPISSQGVIERQVIQKYIGDELLVDSILKIVKCAKENEARSFEVNPLVKTLGGDVYAADCRVTIDDYAVFRQSGLGIKIARELDHPPNKLEKIAYEIEQSDHRGTFYFASLPTENHNPKNGLIGFHGAGGGGSMMSMDAVSNKGFTLANFTDTSGNPSVAKVYKAARIILSQPNLVGYFGSGSGVASQEQYHSAYGLSKAFNETGLDIPAVIRLGGNSEDRAVDILENSCKKLNATVLGYKKDNTPDFCATRFFELVKQAGGKTNNKMVRRVPPFVNKKNSSKYKINGGTLWVDDENISKEIGCFIVEKMGGIFKYVQQRVVPIEDISDRDSDLIACEVECLIRGFSVFFVDLPIEGLD